MIAMQKTEMKATFRRCDGLNKWLIDMEKELERGNKRHAPPSPWFLEPIQRRFETLRVECMHWYDEIHTGEGENQKRLIEEYRTGSKLYL